VTAHVSPSVIRARTSCPDLAAYRDRYAAEYATRGIFIPSTRPQTRPLGTRVHLKIELADGALGYSGAASVIEHVREGARVGYLLHLDGEIAAASDAARAATPPRSSTSTATATPTPTATATATPASTPTPTAAVKARTPTPPPRSTPAPAHVIGRVALTPAPRPAEAAVAVPAPAGTPATAAAQRPPEGAPGAPTASATPRPDVLDALFGAEESASARVAEPEPPRDPFGADDAPPPDPFSPTPPPARATPVPEVPPAAEFVAAGAARLSEADLFADAGAPAEAPGADPSQPTPTPTLSLEQTDGASLSAPLRLPRPPLRVRLARHKVAVAAAAIVLAGAVIAVRGAQRRGAAAEAAFAAEISQVDDRVQAGRLAAPVGDAALDHLEVARRLLAADPRLTSRAKALADTFESLGRHALARGDLQEAGAHYRSALRADPGRASAQAQLETIARTASRRRGAPR
jgi:hypothetical protein